MKHISILVPLGHTSVVNIEGSLQILSEVNGFLAALDRPPLFTIELVGLEKDNSQRNGLFSIRPDKLLSEVPKTDLIIIPAMHGDQCEAMELNKAFIPWIKEQYNHGAELAAFCIGAFFLAGTGLMKGKQCATHWKFANEFRHMFPDVNLVDDKIMTEEDGIYTSGGAYSWLNLTVYLIEKYAGREVAILTSKAYMIDIDRTSQSPFIMFEGQKTHEDEPIKKAQEYIERNFEEKITVNQLAAMFALGRRNLERRFKKSHVEHGDRIYPARKDRSGEKRFGDQPQKRERADVRRRVQRHQGIPHRVQTRNRSFSHRIPQQIQPGSRDGADGVNYVVFTPTICRESNPRVRANAGTFTGVIRH